MKRINIFLLYELGATIDRLTLFDYKTSLEQNISDIMNAQTALKSLDGSGIELKISRSTTAALLMQLENIFSSKTNYKIPDDMKTIGGYYAGRISEDAKKIQTLLREEISSLQTYYVSEKADFNTNILVENADYGFTESIRSKLTNEIQNEWNQAGRALAFELNTASGFHCLRAIELVIFEYYKEISGKILEVPEKNRSWGTYITKLKEIGADEKRISILEQIKNLHRNPLMHPEDSLSLEEAIDLYNISKCFISSLLRETKVCTTPLSITLAANNA